MTEKRRGKMTNTRNEGNGKTSSLEKVKHEWLKLPSFIKLLKAILLQSTAVEQKRKRKKQTRWENDGLCLKLALAEQPEKACSENIQFHVLPHHHACGLICY